MFEARPHPAGSFEVRRRGSLGMRSGIRRCVSPERPPAVVVDAHGPYSRPIRFAFSASYHQVPGAPRSYFGGLAGRP
jgi:hypothetical protein